MRFIHIADLHLGMEPDKDKPWSKMRGRELWDAFADVVDECRKSGTDLLLIAGDLFHKQPLVREVKEVSALLASIPGTKVVMIAGNHDYISGTSGYRDFKWPENVYFLMSDKPESVYFEDIDTEVYGFSYHVRNIYEPVYDGLKPEDPSKINILLGHGGEPTNIPIDWKRLERAGFDYAAMGHLHKPTDISERIRYAGSLEPLDKNETGQHGYIAGEIIAAKCEEKNSSDRYILRSFRVNCAKRSYIKADIEVDCDDTYGMVRRKVMSVISSGGSQNYYVLRFSGEYDPDISLDLDGLDDLGFIAGITDETRPKLDFDRLAAENSGNVIGMFINRIRGNDGDAGGSFRAEKSGDLDGAKQAGIRDVVSEKKQNDPDDPDKARLIREKALYYGVMALEGKL
ncbi:MAG: DNA repair exonuclease [Lachnospiraceae bacterium]|nr:DNA repair exonuclease [Lachnospiraceae bacterium]